MKAAAMIAAGGLACAAGADVLWDFGPATGSNSGNWANITESQNFADDVIFDQPVMLDGFDLFTTFTNVPLGDYHVKIHLDDGAGNPGALFMEWDQDVNSITLDTSGVLDEWKHSFDFDPVALEAGTVYWIGVSGNGWEVGQSSLLNPTPGDGTMAQFSGDTFSFHTPVGDQMFQLRGTFAGKKCPADCNGDGAVNIFDFLCFQGLVSKGDDAADCNGDSAINIFDFLCFQGLVTKGCP